MMAKAAVTPFAKRTGGRRQAKAHLHADQLTRLGRLRIKLQGYLRGVQAEVFFGGLTAIYGIVVLLELLLTESSAPDDVARYLKERVFPPLNVVLVTVLLAEVCLKVFAYGHVYLVKAWNAFDAMVVVASFILTYLQQFNLISGAGVFVIILRLLRLFRLVVVFERIKSRARIVANIAGDEGIGTPLEKVLAYLSEMSDMQGLHPKYHDNIFYIMEVIKSNRLYQTSEDALDKQDLDDETRMWLKGTMAPAPQMLNPKTAKLLGIEMPEGSGGDANKSIKKSMPKALIKKALSLKNIPELVVENEAELTEILKLSASWDFNVLALQKVTKGNTIRHLGVFLFKKHNLLEEVKCGMEVLMCFFKGIQDGYKANPYHNAIHGADVMQTMNYFVCLPDIARCLTPMDKMIALVAGAIHDYKHDGVNNLFHVNSQSELALRYNDVAPLESMHVAEAFALMRSGQGEANILRNLPPDQAKYCRTLMIEMVLSTDMSVHFEKTALFKTKIVLSEQNEDDQGRFKLPEEQDKRLLLKYALHTADVSNPAKNLFLMLSWTQRVVEEFFQQGEKEKALGLPISPFMDRANPNLIKQQCGFIDFIVKPMYELWGEILTEVKKGPLANVEKNKEFWKSLPDTTKPSDFPSLLEKYCPAESAQSGIYSVDERPQDPANG